jgi:MFS family permease
MAATDPNPNRLPGARISLALLLSINLINYIDRSNLSAVEEQVRAQFFRPDDPDAKAWMGSLATAFLVTYMLMAPLFGWLADRMKRWAIIGLGVTLWSVATGMCGLAQSFSMLLVCRVFIGVGEAAWGPTAPTIIADLYPVSRRGAVMAWFNIALSVGSALGFIIGGQVAAAYGWRWAFLAVAPPGLILGLLSFLRKDPQRGLSDALPGSAAVPSRRFQFVDLKILVRTPSFVFNTLGMAAMTFGVGGMAYWMVTYVHEFRLNGDLLTEAGRLDHAHINTLFGGILVVMGLGGTIAGGYLADGLHKRMKGGGAYFLLSGVTMLAAFPMFLLMLVRPFPEAWIYMGASMFLIFVNTGPTNTIIANVIPARMRASAFAFNILVIHTLGDAFSPMVIGFIAGHTRSDVHPHGNMNAGFAVVGAAFVVAGVLWILGARWLRSDTERAISA